jgi:dUTP pyrophosphatase
MKMSNSNHQVDVKIVKMHEAVQIPKYETVGSAGFDLRFFSHIEHERIESGVLALGDSKVTRIETFLNPGETKCFETGLKMSIPFGYELQIRSRSGLSLKGIVVANAPGTIDSDYRGEIKVILINRSDKSFPLGNGDRIAQGILAPVNQAVFQIVDKLEVTERGEGGFGSTGTK